MIDVVVRVLVICACLFVLVGCGPVDNNGGSTSEEWHPLAVDDAQEGGQALIHGRLRITDDCVLLEEQGVEVLLIWPADRTTWDPVARQITLENWDGASNIVSDGNRVVMAGGGSSADEGGLANDDWVESIDWINRPDESCLRGVRWFVSDLNIPQ